MFTLNDLRALLNARPFQPFRFHLSDGGAVEVRHRELVMAGRPFALVGLPDPADPDAAFDRYMAVWYMHITRIEMLAPGAPPFGMPPAGPSESPSPASA